MERETGAQLRSFEEILGMVIRRKRLFFIPFVIVFFISMIVGMFMPRTYETMALVQMKSESIIDPLVRELAVSADVQNAIETVTKQITAWPKMEQLVAQLHMADKIKSSFEKEEYIKKMRTRITIRPRNRDIIEVIYQDRNPAYAQQVTNTLTQNFLEENSRIRKEEARNAIDFIQGQLKIYREKLESSQKNFSTSKIDSDLRVAHNRKILLQERMNSLQKIIPSQVTTEQNPVVSQLQVRLGQLETELARLMLDAKEGNPRVLEVRREIAGIQTRLNAEINNTNVKESISTFNPIYLQAEQEFKSVEMEIEYLNKRKAEIDKRGKVTEKNISETELANLERNKQVDEDVYQMLLRQLESAYVSERLEDSEKGNRFSVIEYARLPLVPVKPKMRNIIIVGLLAGIGTGFGLVFMVEKFSGAFQTAEQVHEVIGLRALGSVSKFMDEKKNEKVSLGKIMVDKINKVFNSHQVLSGLSFVKPHIIRKVNDKSISEQLIVYHDPNSVISEEFRVLRTHIFHGSGGERAFKTIVVTSTLRGEGKSTTSSNLAVAIADAGHKTLLVDCDLRKGVVHSLFSVSQEKGLNEVLLGEANLNESINVSIIKNLSLLVSGNRSGRPSELLDSSKMEEIVAKLKNQFDCIILDSPPVINLPDASILSRFADAVIMVIQAGRAKKNDVMLAYNKLKQVDAKIEGFVLTNVEYYMPKYVYDYYYNYN